MKHVSERDWVCTTCGTDAWSGDYGRLCFDAEFFDDDNIGYNGVPIDCAACDGDYRIAKQVVRCMITTKRESLL